MGRINGDNEERPLIRMGVLFSCQLSGSNSGAGCRSIHCARFSIAILLMRQSHAYIHFPFAARPSP